MIKIYSDQESLYINDANFLSQFIVVFDLFIGYNLIGEIHYELFFGQEY